MMPTDTPHGTRSRAAPRCSANELAGGAQLGVEHGHLQRGLGHPVALERRRSAAADGVGVEVAGGEQPGTQKRSITSAAPSTYSAE